MTSPKLLKLIILLLALSFALGQTFQYSRGWTNGKRSDSHRHGQDPDLVLLQKIFSNPCQMEKLKYMLEGKPINDKVFLPCDMLFPAPEDQPEDGPESRLRRTVVVRTPTYAATGSQPQIRSNADLDNFL